MPTFLFNLLAHLTYFWKDFSSFIIFYVIFFLILSGLFVLLVKRPASVLKTIFLNIVIFLFLLVNVFYGFELYYRYFFDVTDNIFQIKTMQRWKDRHVIINAFGFRNDHFFQDKDAREVRIAVLGDSYTWGYGLKNQADRWGDLLGQKLSQVCANLGKTVKIYNLAMPGMSTRNEAELIKEYFKRYKIDAAVIGYYMDDGSSELTARHIQPCYNRIFAYRYNPLLTQIINNSYAAEYFYIRFYNRFIIPRFGDECWTLSNEKEYQDPELWIRHIKRLQEIVDYTKGHDIPLAFIIIPYLKSLGPNYPATAIHQRLVTFFEENKIPVVDLLPIYSQYKSTDLMVNQFDYHANELGHRLAFENLYANIKDIDPFTCKKGSKP